MKSQKVLKPLTRHGLKINNFPQYAMGKTEDPHQNDKYCNFDF